MQGMSPEIPNRLPLALQPANRGQTTGQDAKLVNAYIERQGEEIWIYERPGMSQHSQPSGGAATGRGAYTWLGDIYSIFGDKLYKNGVVVPGGGNSLDTTNGVYRFQQCLGTSPKLTFGNGVKAYNYDSANNVVAIADPDFPAAFVKGWSYLDGATYVGKSDGSILGDDLNDPTAWDPLNVIIAQIYPDPLVALAKQLTYVIALKGETTEVFYDANTSAGSALGRNEGALVMQGCVSADSVQDLDGVLSWLSTGKGGSISVYAMEKLTAFEIATNPIQRLLENPTISTGVLSWILKHNGHRFYGLTVKSANVTLVYDFDQKLWSQWTDKNGNYLPIVGWCTTASGQPLFQHESDGRLYYLSDTYASDNGDAITVDLYTPNFDAGIRRQKMLSRLELICDQLVGAKMGIRFNDDDYKAGKWTNYRYVDLSLRRPYIDNCGSFYRRVTNFNFKSATVRMPRLQAVELQMGLGTL